jgi:hypothetical protein
MPNENLPTSALLAVFGDVHRADEVAGELVRRGIDPSRIHIDRPRDERLSLRAEMLDEATEAFVAPQVGVVYPKETAKAGTVVGGPFILAGAVIGAIVLALVPISDWAVWARALLGALCGAGTAATVAMVVIPAMAVRNPHDPLPAEAGVTLRVDQPDEGVERLLVGAHPRRLDRLGPQGQPLGTVVTEEAFRSGGTVEEVRDSFLREHRAEPEDKTR